MILLDLTRIQLMKKIFGKGKGRGGNGPTTSGSNFNLLPYQTNRIQTGLQGEAAARGPPLLAHGLEDIILKPGPHFLQNPHTNAFNFDPYLQNIPELASIKQGTVKNFLRAAHDIRLHTAALEDGECKFTSSTSSFSGLLSHIYSLLADKTSIEKEPFSSDLTKEISNRLSPFVYMGTEFQLLHKNGIYAIDSIEKTEENVLMTYGHILELFLTNTPQQFEQFLANSKTEIEHPGEVYHYGKLGTMMLRAQLDTQSPLLPDKSTFDLKTRALLPLRKDLANYKDHFWYEITQMEGIYRSFEREYYDMLRAAFMKYSIQVRIGDMAGIYVSYHNTKKMFGFEYISIEKMEKGLWGNNVMGPLIFKYALAITNDILNSIIEIYPGQSTRIFFRKPTNHETIAFVEPIEPLPGQLPVCLNISAISIIDGKRTKKPILDEKNATSWQVELDISTEDWNQKEYDNLYGRYNKSKYGGFPGRSFIEKMKKDIQILDQNGISRL